jgi:hypothetical protein
MNSAFISRKSRTATPTPPNDGDALVHRLRSPGAQFVERQIGHDALTARGALVDDHLVHRAEHPLHRLEIEALAGDFGRARTYSS